MDELNYTMKMATISFDENPTIVVVDKDKNSTYAVKWAIEHLLIMNPTLILIHVKTRHSHNDSQTACVLDAHARLTEEIFSPFRTLCARKGISVQEVVLEGTDMHSTILDYINKNHVTNLVLGSTSRNAITRKFWTHDLPTLINKFAPNFCSVYVISKGKAHSIRPAVRHAVNSFAPPRLSSTLPSRKLNPSELDECTRTLSLRSIDSSKPLIGETSRGRSKFSGKDFVETDVMDYYKAAMDITQVQIRDSAKFGEAGDYKSEVERLKLEVKQTMELYNTTCKEAIAAQKQAEELRLLKLDEGFRLEQAKHAEEAALKLAEIEKAKCKAAIEAAEKAQKIAERELERRKYAELKVKRESDEKNRALDVLSNNDVRYRKYTIEEIEAATDNFSMFMKIGEGGYGPVYKGKLDHTTVAIKVLRPDAAQGRKQFQQEIEVLSCMRHPNMVILMGACPEYGCLVYEFMNNGSLEDRLFGLNNTPPIPWATRFKLAADIATGLLFLHQAKPEPLVHRDLKPANILLDRHYTCKISDVGLARLVPPNVADSVTQYHMTSAAGTFCYIDPEYQQTGKLGTKSDIYSLGVMLLQIITVRPPMGLTHHVKRAIQKGTLAELLDPSVMDWPVEETIVFAKLALQCAQLRKKERPDLDKVILPELNRLKELGMTVSNR